MKRIIYLIGAQASGKSMFCREHENSVIELEQPELTTVDSGVYWSADKALKNAEVVVVTSNEYNKDVETQLFSCAYDNKVTFHTLQITKNHIPRK